MNRTLLFIILIIGIFAGKTYATDIEIKIDNYPNDTLLLGYFYWDKQYIKDTLYRNKKGIFKVDYKEDLPAGMYMIITKPGNDFVQLILDKSDQKFEVSWDFEDAHNTLSFKGSDENEIFHRYVTYLSEARKSAEEIQTRPDYHPTMLDSLNEAVQTKQKEILADHPQSMTALVIRTNEDVEIPTFEGSEEEVQNQTYEYYLRHYLDHVDLSDARLPYTSFLFQKLDRYMTKVVMQIPDSINAALDRLLDAAGPSPITFKAILIHYLNKYANSEFVGMDAVYVHLVNEYYAKGLAPWVDEESLIKMKDDASNLEPILIGKQAPHIVVNQRDGTPLDLYKLESKYTVLIFWAQDCGHCKKAMPKLKEIYPELKEKGVEVVAICTKLMDKEAGCWEFIDKNGTDLWINATDKYLRSKFKQKYNVTSTPQLFILDKDKKILTKKIAIEKLPEVIELLEKQEQAG